MKKITAIALIISACFLLGAGCAQKEAAPERPDFGPGVSEIPVDSLVPAEEFTLGQVAEHAAADDCWVVIEGVVYDITNFASEHPAGSESVTRWCGQDATEGFNTKNMTGGSHSVRAKLNLDSYFKGNLIQ